MFEEVSDEYLKIKDKVIALADYTQTAKRTNQYSENMHANDAKRCKMRGNRSGLVFSLIFFALVGKMDQVLPTNHRGH